MKCRLIRSLLNDVIAAAASDNGMTVSVELERKGLCSTLRYCRRILLEGLKEPAKHLREDRRWLRLHRMKDRNIESQK
jgi:hypothetical protein